MTSLVNRFINRLNKIQVATGPVQASEMDRAEKIWIAHIQSLYYGDLLECIKGNKPHNLKTQLGVYIDDDGLLR